MENEKKQQEILKIETGGTHPLPRFGHSIEKINKIQICLFGGAVGDSKKITYSNETYIYNILTKIWIKLNFKNSDSVPKERAAHASASNLHNQMVIHGGSSSNGLLADDSLYYLTLKTNYNNDEDKAEWKKVITNGPTPGPRYGHSLSYISPYFVLFGGNLNPKLSNDVWIINLNNNSNEWKKITFPENGNVPIPRVYHSGKVIKNGPYTHNIIIFGGRDEKDNPLNDLWCLSIGQNCGWKQLINPKGKKLHPRNNHVMVCYDSLLIFVGGKGVQNSSVPIEVFDTENNECYTFKYILMNRHSSFINNDDIFLFGGFAGKNYSALGDLYNFSLKKIFANSPLEKKLIDKKNINKNVNSNLNSKQQFKLFHEVIVSNDSVNDNKKETEDSLVFRTLSISKLPDENKRVGGIGKNNFITEKQDYNKDIINKFINILLRPLDWYDEKKMDPIHQNLPFSREEIQELILEVKQILSQEQSLIKIRSPCKVFGNIFGVYNDLMRFFESYGNPSDNIQNGDIHVMQYIFLGDFCDRGLYSLEVIFLLFALKIKYPFFIYIIRGHHEDRNINAINGLGDECKERLNEDINQKNSIFNLINEVFDFLPFGVLVDNTMLLIHGGIGSSIKTLDDINNIRRPINIIHNIDDMEHFIPFDLLWSEYHENVDNFDVCLEKDKSNKGLVVKFGPKRLNNFFEKNGLNLLITSNQFIKEGFCTFNDDKVLMLFSASNYMDKLENIGGMIIIGKKTANKRMNIVPKLINFCESKKRMYRQENTSKK